MTTEQEAAQPDRAIADMGGSAALPRKNGELVFDAAWEARVFGMTISMHERQLFDWNEFRDELIEEIGEADRQGGESNYYERWLDAFEHLLVEKGLLTSEELAARLADFESGRRDDAF
ncbi:MAG: nitrile hydratase accessory protein [Gemmataceae bacterium]|nr:nitrile hydratase accessory protein [Gemmataceae bacterium]